MYIWYIQLQWSFLLTWAACCGENFFSLSSHSVYWCLIWQIQIATTVLTGVNTNLERKWGVCCYLMLASFDMWYGRFDITLFTLCCVIADVTRKLMYIYAHIYEPNAFCREGSTGNPHVLDPRLLQVIKECFYQLQGFLLGKERKCL